MLQGRPSSTAAADAQSFPRLRLGIQTGYTPIPLGVAPWARTGFLFIAKLICKYSGLLHGFLGLRVEET